MLLALNCGSSSLKYGAYRTAGENAVAAVEGEVEEIGNGGECRNHADALEHAFEDLKKGGATAFDGVGHRFVHGGPKQRNHVRLDADVLRDLEAAVAYAPLHMPAALAVLRAVEKKLPGTSQVVCLDTAFHREMPDVSKGFAMPSSVRERGVERYGFHGLSMESIVRQLDRVPERLVVAHLGNGASITAILGGVSVDTSMGMTPTGGLMMGTRCGDMDPGVLIYLLRHGYETADDLARLCDRESGLRGVSGISSDVRELLGRRRDSPQSDLALRMFCYRVKKTIAGMAAALRGIDMVVFTGGIGEHSTELRSEICEGLTFLGDVEMKVLPSLEDEQIVLNTARLLSA